MSDPARKGGDLFDMAKDGTKGLTAPVCPKPISTQSASANAN